MASSLPFVVQPRLKPIIELIGSEDSGQFEIERRGYLTVAEKAYYQQSMSDDDSMVSLQNVGRKISRETGIPLQDVMLKIGEALQGEKVNPEDQELLEKYQEDIGESINALMRSQERGNACRALALIVSRVNAAFPVEELFKLHPDIIEGLSNLYKEEEQKSVDALIAAQASTPKSGSNRGRKASSEGK